MSCDPKNTDDKDEEGQLQTEARHGKMMLACHKKYNWNANICKLMCVIFSQADNAANTR